MLIWYQSVFADTATAPDDLTTAPSAGERISASAAFAGATPIIGADTRAARTIIAVVPSLRTLVTTHPFVENRPPRLPRPNAYGD